MSRKLYISIFTVLLALVFSVFTGAPASAVSPDYALSARPADSVYSVARFDDLSWLLQNVFSMSNIEMVASLVGPEEAQGVRLVGSFASQIPARSLAIVSGATADEGPFMQAAALMPESLRPRMARVADGSASGVDLITLLLGEGAMMLAMAFAPEVTEGAFGPFYTVAGQAAFAARGDLLLMASSPDELEASIAALENGENRLTFNRRFDSPNYFFLHMDAPTLAMLSGEDSDEFIGAFRAPLRMESAFSSGADSFLWSVAGNIMESMIITDADERYDVEPEKGARLFLAGGGRLLFALSGALSFRTTDLATSPELRDGWNNIVSQFEAMLNISESELVDLLNGSFTLALGSNATIFDRSAPGGYVAFTGREGAAANILGKIMDSEGLGHAIPMAPLNIEGWDSLYMLDPALLPVPLLLGVKGDTFFLGVVDSDALAQTPEIPAQAASMLEEPLMSALFIDNAAIWNWLRQEIADPNSLLAMPLALTGADIAVKGILQLVLEADLSVPFIKTWSPDFETAFTEFSIVDVPDERRLLPRLMSIGHAFAPALQ